VAKIINYPMLCLKKFKMSKLNNVCKRIFDIVGSLIALIIFSPFMLLAALALWFESGWPVFYSHERVGKNGKKFWIYKIRSMVPNADEFLWERNPKLLEEYKKSGYKLKNDPRVTGVGRTLRRLDIDEMPQFLNVLKGEMSLVGPRAYKPNELEEQAKKHPQAKNDIRKSLKVKPGITGLWQVSGRNKVDFKERIRLDAFYSENQNIFLDIKLILKTPFAVLENHGD